MTWARLQIRVSASRLDSILERLADSPTTGIEELEQPGSPAGEAILVAYFKTSEEASTTVLAIQAACQHEPALSVVQNQIPEVDWLQQWKADLAPVRVGRFVLAPLASPTR